MKTIVKGDLLKMAKEGKFDVIVHGCNCFCTMGAGIAKQIKDQFEWAFMADCETEAGDKSKLGNYTYTYALTEELTSFTGKLLKQTPFYIVNAYTQYNPGRDVSYDAIYKVFKEIADDFSGMKIAYPAIGCGIAGGDWEIVSAIINHCLKGEDHTFVEFAG